VPRDALVQRCRLRLGEFQSGFAFVVVREFGLHAHQVQEAAKRGVDLFNPPLREDLAKSLSLERKLFPERLARLVVEAFAAHVVVRQQRWWT
jgi:hypothetical protein